MWQRVGHQLIRWRYVILTAWAMGWFAVAYDTRPRGVLSDWLWFEFSARTLIHLNSHYSSGALALYAHYPWIQIGPPPIVIVAALQWLSPAAVRLIMTVVMALAGIWCVRCAELTVRSQAAPDRQRRLQLLVLQAGLLVTPLWAWEAARWAHLDDVMAITATMTAMAIIASGKRWWLAGVLIGLAVASKPWALATAPCLLGLPREDRARASLVAMIVAAACWGPFVLSNPQTISALGSFKFTVDAASTPHFLGMGLGDAPRWVRPAQFVGGFLVALAAVRQRRWLAVPLIGFAFRVVIDPQAWTYYGIGPVAAAALWDCAGKRKWPVWTVLTAVVEFGVPAVAPSWWGALRLAWFLAIAIAVLRPNRSVENTDTEPAALTDSVPSPVLA
jgi:hypothetical protein